MRTSSALLLLLSLVILVTPVAAEENSKTVSLFNGKDLTGWKHFLWDRKSRTEDKKTPASKVWSVEDGILVCQGRPVGYLRTVDEYENYELTLEWRWPAGTDGGNNGVLVHTTTPMALGLWPKSIEVQLFRRNAGDFWVIGTELDVKDEESRKKGRRHLNLTDDSEKPIGEWNTMKITCQGDKIRVFVNDDLVNEATNCSVTKGAIALQSEGALIHYRNVKLTPLK